jgi:hypothetical protein
MPSFMLVRHKVKDFATWKPVYDAHAPKRKEAGLTERQLLRGTDDPGQVVVLFEAQDLARARAFANSDDLRDTMTRAGVQDRPDIYYLNSAGK